MSGSVQKQGSLKGRAAFVVAPFVALFVLALCASAAHAAVGDTFFDRCLNAGAAQAPCTSSPGTTGAYPDALSPDGKQLYVAVAGGTPPGGGSAEDPAILIFDRNAATGKVTRRTGGVTSCVTKSGSSGACTAAPQLDNPQDIVVSPDGTSVYVSNFGTQTILEFKRAAGGGLSLIAQCQGGGSGCVAATGMGNPHALAMSPDSKTLYVRTTRGFGMGSLLVFNRTAADGKLTQLAAPNGCWAEPGLADCTTGRGISQQGWQMTATNTNVYTTGHNDPYIYFTAGCGFICIFNVPSSGTIATFGRSSTGTLTQPNDTTACISNNGASGGIQFSGPAPQLCTDGSDALDQARSVTASPDGKSVYVGTDNAIVQYARGAAGALVEKGCAQRPGVGYTGCTDATSVGQVYRLRVTPSGTDVIADTLTFNGFTFLKRNTSTGVLSSRVGKKQCLTRDGSGGNCDSLGAVGGFGDVAVSPDSMFLYLTGNTSGSITTLHRDAAPVCQSKTISVPFQTSVAVPLTCGDANGDTLALRITKQPTAGTLGGGGTIDPATKTVRYSPPLGFSGTDSFKYTAKGQGIDASAATVTLNVGAAPPPPPGGGGGGGIDNDGDGFFAGQDCNDNNAKINPSAKEIRGNQIDEDCNGVASLLPDLRSSVAPTWSVAGSKTTAVGFLLKGLKKGWKVTLSCKGKGCSFKSKKIKNKKTKKGDFNALKKLGKARNYKAGQTLTVKFTARGYNTKFSIFKFKSGKLPSSVAKCQTAGSRKLRACK